MNDQELDQILEAWTLAPPSPSLRERVRSQYRSKPPRIFRLPRFVLGSLATGAAIFLIGVLAFSQTSKTISSLAGIPLTVDTESTYYGADGTVRHLMVTYYEFNGRQAILTESMPGNPSWTMGRHVIDALGFIAIHVAPSVIFSQSERQKANYLAFVKAGCIAPEPTVLGYETVAGYRTVKVTVDRPEPRRPHSASARGFRFTNWWAPDLDCFPMGRTVEEIHTDGTTRLESRETVLAVHVNR